MTGVSPLQEEVFEQVLTLFGKNSRLHCKAMVQTQIVVYLVKTTASAALCVVGTKEYGRDSGLLDSSATHDAGLQSYIHDAIAQTPTAQLLTRRPNSYYFSMLSWIMRRFLLGVTE